MSLRVVIFLNDKEKKQKQIQLLQQNLRSIRQIVGWTAEQLGEKIGVTKQTIGDLENIKRPMNLTQYLAFRSILNDEITNNPERGNVLKQVIEILVDKGAELEEENYIEIKDTIDTVAASASKGKEGIQLTKLLVTLLSSPNTIRALSTIGIIISQSSTGIAKGLKNIK
jgi:transcriptional regulator with XRE-family HTH domain